jgi:hypothetical protein
MVKPRLHRFAMRELPTLASKFSAVNNPPPHYLRLNSPSRAGTPAAEMAAAHLSTCGHPSQLPSTPIFPDRDTKPLAQLPLCCV